MALALLLARLLLAAVFAIAGLAKLADRAGTRRALRDFGVPGRLTPTLGLLLPLVELAVALALLPTTTAWWGAIGALALLLLFVLGIGVSLARGRAPDCHCFGQLYSAPAGWPTLARNSLLALVAAFVVGSGVVDAGPSAVAWLGRLSPLAQTSLGVGLLLLALVAVQGWFLLQLLRQQGRILARLETLEAAGASGEATAVSATVPATPPPAGLPVDAPAPTFALAGLYGETLTLDALRARGKPTLLFFTDPNCGPCTALLPDLGRWQQESAARVTLAVLSRGTVEANRAKSSEYGLTHVLLQQDREVAAAYQVQGTPSAVLVRPDGTIGSPLAAGAEAIRLLVARTAGLPSTVAPPTLPILAPDANGSHGNNGQAPSAAATVAPATVGAPAPPLALPDLTGQPVDLGQFRGQPTLVLFWNPGCGFCQQMLADLKEWEAHPPAGAPRLLVVSTGTVEANQALGLRAPVVLDPGGQAMAAFGVQGTPMAVLVDATGKIASAPAAGAPAVLALARATPSPDAANSRPAVPPPPVARRGERAPALALPDLAGKTRNLAHFRGRPVLVLFWNPACGFCQQLLPDLKTWEAQAPKGAPRLLVVSTGTLEANRALGLRAPVVLDPAFSVGPQFGVQGTPSAVLVDAQGRLASDVAVGAAAILGLVGAPPALARST